MQDKIWGMEKCLGTLMLSCHFLNHSESVLYRTYTPRMRKKVAPIKLHSSVHCNTHGYYRYLSIKTRRVGFRLHTSTCVFPSINILAVNI